MAIFAAVQRKFLGNLFLLQALNWLVKPVWIFWIDRLAQVKLGDEWYGKYYVVLSFGLLFNMLLDFGLNSYVASEVGKNGDPSSAKPALRLRIYLGLLYVLLVAGFGTWQEFDPAILGLIIANQFLAGFVLFFRSVLQGRHWFRTDSIISITDRAIAILICAFFIYGNQFQGSQGILIFLLAQTLGYGIALFFAAFYAYRKRYDSQISEIKSPLPISKLLNQTAWFATLAFAMSIFTRIDALMIRNLSPGGYAEAGLYAQSFRLLDAALIFSALISTMLLPIFSRMLQKGEKTGPLIWLNMRIILFVAIPSALAANFFGAEILHLLYADSFSSISEFQRSINVFFPIMTCFIPMALVHIFGTWLTASNKVKFLSILAFFCIAINIVLNYVLIPEYDAPGAAWACLVTQIVFASGSILVVVKSGKFKVHFGRAALLIIWMFLALFCFWFFGNNFHSITGLIMACAAYLMVTMLSGLFWPELKRVLKIISK